MAVNGADRPAAGEYLQVQTTTDSRAEAMELARAAVAARLAACSQVAGPVASTYWWNDEIERAEEWFVFFKLPADRYEELAAFLVEQHSYDEPEILATPFVAGSAVVPDLDHRGNPRAARCPPPRPRAPRPLSSPGPGVTRSGGRSRSAPPARRARRRGC